MKILFSMVGSPLYVDREASDYGGTEALPLIRRLIDVGHEVLYYGRTIGDPHDFTAVEPDMSRLDRHVSREEFRSRVEDCEKHVIDWAPDVTLHMAGPKFTWSVSGMTQGATPSDASVRYSGPQLSVAIAVARPRIVIVTDPKVYPHEGEMVEHPCLEPRALLSQEDCVFDKRVQGAKYLCSAVASGAEYWWTDGMLPRQSTGVRSLAICAHSHRGKLSDERGAIWDRLLEGRTYSMCGRGWEGDPQWLGVLPAFEDVMTHLQSGLYTTMLPQKTGFNSTKIRLAALAGCCPLPYGRGEKWTYDADARVLPLDHPARVDDYDLGAAMVRVEAYGRERVIQEVLDATRPDYTMLDRALAGPLPQPELGGYACLT